MNAKITSALAIATVLTLACTNNNRSGSSMSDEGTVQSNRVNSDMENDRTATGDTLESPGSNAEDNRNRKPGDPPKTENPVTPASTGTGHDPNMAGQSDTHGRKTTAGDK